MTYRELYESATRKLEKSEITLGEYEEMTKPLNEDVRTWIPVSERLPDKDKYNRGSVWERSVLVTAYFKWDDAKQTFITMRLAEDVINNNFIDECIIAWMPLPKPYKAERSE